jgi:hypothetical protein
MVARIKRRFDNIRRRVQAIKLAYHALTCPYDAPRIPGHFPTQQTARSWLADARGMWHY